ncbi:hypothetical protein AYI68_g6934, partial [Smittium mucronatum]
MIPNQE